MSDNEKTLNDMAARMPDLAKILSAANDIGQTLGHVGAAVGPQTSPEALATLRGILADLEGFRDRMATLAAGFGITSAGGLYGAKGVAES